MPKRIQKVNKKEKKELVKPSDENSLYGSNSVSNQNVNNPMKSKNGLLITALAILMGFVILNSFTSDSPLFA